MRTWFHLLRLLPPYAIYEPQAPPPAPRHGCGLVTRLRLLPQVFALATAPATASATMPAATATPAGGVLTAPCAAARTNATTTGRARQANAFVAAAGRATTARRGPVRTTAPVMEAASTSSAHPQRISMHIVRHYMRARTAAVSGDTRPPRDAGAPARQDSPGSIVAPSHAHRTALPTARATTALATVPRDGVVSIAQRALAPTSARIMECAWTALARALPATQALTAQRRSARALSSRAMNGGHVLPTASAMAASNASATMAGRATTARCGRALMTATCTATA